MRKLFIACALLITCVFISPFSNHGLAEDSDEEIKLYMGESKIVSVSSPTRIAIGNPAIADVSNVGKSELTVSAKSVGNTSFIIWDSYGEQPYRIRVFAENTAELKKRVDNLLSALNIPTLITKAEDEEAKVVLSGTVKYAKDKERIATALAQVKDKIIDLVTVKEEEAVVEIDVQVIELNRGSQDKLGFTWPGSINLTEVGSPGIQTGGTTWGKLFKVASETRDAFTLKLDALIQEGNARILSRPRLSCQSGKEAKLVVGGEVPILSGTVTPGTSGSGSVGATTGGSVEYKEYGVILNIKPNLEESGRIHLNLEVVVSEVGEQVQTDYALAYTMTKRTATTELFLDDGQTMALGGLIKKKTQEELRRVPWLSDVPVLGVFFRQKTANEGWKSDTDKINDTELFITLTPHLVGQVKQQDAFKPVPAELPTVSDDNLADPVLKYSKIVQKKILDKLVYPSQAKEAGFQGTARLSLNLSYRGDLLNVKLKDSSNYRVLDDNTVNTAKQASPYPPFPATIKDKDIWVDIPITYQLE